MKRAPYDLALESRTAEGPPVYEFETADGVCSKRSFRDAELTLIEGLWEESLGELRSVQANYRVVGVVLAARAERVEMIESSARAAALCEHNAGKNGIDATVTLAGDLAALDAVDTAAYAPKPYTPIPVARQRIADALASLDPSGRVFVAASKCTGLSRFEDCFKEIATNVERRDGVGDCSLLVASRPASFDPPTYVTPREFQADVDGVTLSLVSAPGLFSPTDLDDGTRRLLEATSIEDGERVLDCCSGYGAVGAYAGRVADCEVVCSDDDRVATCCAERTLAASGVDASVLTADCTDGVADRTFDRVLCNPPTHAGDGVLAELFAGIHDVLAPDGEATIVHHRGVDLNDHLETFRTVDRKRADDAYNVLDLLK